MKNTSDSRHKHRQAGLKASATKGKEEEIRAAAMRAWTIEHGKNDAANPYSRLNYAGSPEWIARFRSAGALDPVKRRFLRPLRGLSEHRAERVRHHASAYLQSHRAIAASVEGRYPYTATVHPPGPQNPRECHLYCAEGCHLYMALTYISRIIYIMENCTNMPRSHSSATDPSNPRCLPPCRRVRLTACRFPTM